MNKLPNFSLFDFRKLLIAFAKNGYSFGRIISPDIATQTVYIRHDVDFFVGGWCGMPILEAEMGIPATYYFLPIAYNFNTKRVREYIKQVHDMSHTIGLHFDLRHYSECPDKARKCFDVEVQALENIIGEKIFTVARHQPAIWKHQTFNIDDYIDPYSKEWLDMAEYISDSCRAWRDENLLKCFGDHPPFQVQFITHPEQWLNHDIEDRIEYLDFMRDRAMKEFDKRFIREKHLWKIHEGGIAHDKRESNNNNIVM